MEDTVWSSPALYDIDGDGRLEILIGGDQSAGGAINWAGGEFRAIEYTAGSTVSCSHCREIWKHQLNDTMWSSPAIGDIDGDGRPEVIVGGGNYYNRSDGHKVFAWHVDDGSALPGWPVATSGSTMPSPALGDLNGDGIPEVVASSADGYVRAFNRNGSVKWATRLWHFTVGQLGGPVASPIIADLNGDGQNDVGAGNDYGYFVLNGANGAIMNLLDNLESHDSAAAVGDFGSGVGWRLVVAGFNTPNHTSRLQSFSMPAPVKTPPWPMFRRDPLHHAGPVALHLLPAGQCRGGSNPKAHPVSASSRGYWVAAANGAVFALKGAPFHGSPSGRLHGSAVAIAATHSGNGYYVLDNGGGIFPFGDARSFGSMAGKHLQLADHRARADSFRSRLLVDGGRRRRVQLRRRALLRLDGRQAAQPADHLDRGDTHRTRLLVARLRRRCVQLRRRALPRIDRQPPPQLTGAVDGDGAVGPGLLVGRG